MFEAADGGTVFLDEIGDMPLALQAKLLAGLLDATVAAHDAMRAIEEKLLQFDERIRKLGG